MNKNDTSSTQVPTQGHKRTFPRSFIHSPACYGVIGDFLRTVEPDTEAAPVAIFVQLIVAFGNVIGRRAHFVHEATPHHLNLYTAIVGKSAKGRKGTSWGIARHLLTSVEAEWLANNVINGLSSGEGLIKALTDRKELQDHDNGSSLTPDKRRMVCEGEFAGVLQVLRREGNTLSSALRNLWDSGSVNILTRNDPLKVTDAHLSIVGHITRDELLRLLTNSDAGNGFANRFLWIYAERSKFLPEGGNIRDINFSPFTRRLKEAIDFAKQTGELRRDDEARRLWAQIYPELTDDIPGMLGSVTARAEAQTMRLACLFALLDCSAVVRKVHLQAALSLWHYSFDSARFIFGDSTGDEVAEKILEALGTEGDAGLTTTQISNLFDRNLTSARVRSTLKTLQAAGQVAVEKKPSKHGRPAEIWTLTNPPTSNEENEINEESKDPFPWSRSEDEDDFDDEDDQSDDSDDADEMFYRRCEEEGEC